MNQLLRHLSAALLLASIICDGSADEFVTQDVSSLAYSRALSSQDAQKFEAGRAEFHQRWVAPLSIGGTWGRGPTFNAEACSDCHVGNGRGAPPQPGADPPHAMVVRLSVPGVGPDGGPIAHPHYGDQLQDQGELGEVPAEGEIHLTWREHFESLADGERVALRSPVVMFRRLKFGPLGNDVMTSLRLAPAVFGLGLLEAVAEETLLAIERAQASLGLHGRLNRVWDVEARAPRIGRFGWKASQPTLRQQNAAAYHRDIGVTTRIFPTENCPPVQRACRLRPGSDKPEQSESGLEAVTYYLQALAVPAQPNADHPLVKLGRQLFEDAGCAHCHLPVLRTDESALLPSPSIIRPYTDLLLHDMGEGLADGRPDFAAGPRDWRTAPLWGLGLRRIVNGNSAMLHDGRARSYAEAILWHGGEALAARQAFIRLDRAQRAALGAFLDAL